MERPQIDPASPLVMDTHELGRRPGMMRAFTQTVDAPADLGTTVIGVPKGASLDLDIRLEAVMEGVLVTASVQSVAVGECVRCLDPVSEPIDVEVQELFAYPDRVDPADIADREAQAQLVDELANIEPALRDAVVTALPFNPLCRPDCPGLCSECGARLADDPEHSHDFVDPRWSALQSMFDPNVTDETKES